MEQAQLEAHDTKSASELISWAAEEFGAGLAMSSSFGAHSAVMLHLVSQAAPNTPVVFIDTGYLFPETYRFVEQLTQRLDLHVQVANPAMTAARREALFGAEWEQGTEGVLSYLRFHKVDPMQRALTSLGTTAWMAGLRADQTTHRAGLPRVGIQDGRVKIHPILNWNDEDVAAYIETHDLPLHPLVASGYRSIGDVHSTLPTVAGMDPRAGRILGKKQECGLHLPMSEGTKKSLRSSGL